MALHTKRIGFEWPMILWLHNNLTKAAFNQCEEQEKPEIKENDKFIRLKCRDDTAELRRILHDECGERSNTERKLSDYVLYVFKRHYHVQQTLYYYQMMDQKFFSRIFLRTQSIDANSFLPLINRVSLIECLEKLTTQSTLKRFYDMCTPIRKLWEAKRKTYRTKNF
jgi:hypothetical protein